MSNQSAVDNTNISLDSLFKAMQHWRNNKQDYDGPGIPDNIWEMIFKLEEQDYTKNDLCRAFTLNSQQYDKKRSQHYSSTQTSSEPKLDEAGNKSQQNTALEFSEAILAGEETPPLIPPLTQATQQTKQATIQLKSTDIKPERYVDTTTVIVECIRADGHRLKIHMTNHRLDDLMQNFLSQEASQ